MHGHNYVVMITAEAHSHGLDDLGRVIDFSVLKAVFDSWVQEHWDHAFIHKEDDAAVVEALEAFDASEGQDRKAFSMPYNPTAENMARYLWEVVCDDPRLAAITITQIRMHETENCYADYFPGVVITTPFGGDTILGRGGI